MILVELAARHPEILGAVAEDVAQLDMDDLAHSEFLLNEYDQLWNQQINVLVQNVADDLRVKGN